MYIQACLPDWDRAITCIHSRTFAHSVLREGVNGNIRVKKERVTPIYWSMVNVSFYVFHQRNKSHLSFSIGLSGHWSCFFFSILFSILFFSLCFHSNVDIIIMLCYLIRCAKCEQLRATN